MSIRHLDHLFDPASVAVIGASDRPHSVGAMVWQRLREGGFQGPCWPVNPRLGKLEGQPCHPDVASLPAAPDLAVICTPAAAVVPLIDALARRGTKAAVVLTAGLDAAQKQAMLAAARPALLRILGPNGIGLLVPRRKLNASFAPADARSGPLAFVSQSGALLTAMLDWARGRGIGFSQIVSLGECADIDFADVLDYLGSDGATRAILLYVESIRDARKFMSAARAAARNKPVIVVKSGRSSAGRAAAGTHTGKLAGEDAVFDAAIRRAGMLRVDTLQQLFIAAETLSHLRESLALRTGDEAELADAERLTILTNGGGAGVMAADAAAEAGLALPALPEAVRTALDGVLPALWSGANPVDMIGDAPPQRYVDALRILQAAPETGQLLLIHAPTAIVPSGEIADALAPLAREASGRLTTCWLGGPAVEGARRRFGEAGIPCHDTPEDAVRALALVATYRRNQAQLMEAPPDRGDDPFDADTIRTLVQGALDAGRRMLTEPEAKALLAAAGIPVVPTQVVKASPIAAQRAADGIGYPVVLKILSPDLSHKSDVGGVALALDDGTAVNAAARAMLRRIRRLRPDARLDGFTVQAMVRRPQALELIAGTHLDELFGPVVLFGAGGTAVEVLQDRALALPPLNAPLARQLVSRTRVARLLRGWRDVPPADTAAIERVLVVLSRLMAEVPEIAGIDINPLLADAQGVIALDARVQVDPRGPGGAARFAIRPYPTELVRQLDWHGQRLTIRPIRPEDEQRHRAFLERIAPADIRMRVFYSRRSIERSELARLTQIDYEREMALVATAAGPDGIEETLGAVRAVADPDNHDAEFGILVRSDLKGRGLGRLLMSALIDHLKRRGTRRLVATVLHENSDMLALARALGFAAAPELAGDGMVGVALGLQGEAQGGEPKGGGHLPRRA